MCTKTPVLSEYSMINFILVKICTYLIKFYQYIFSPFLGIGKRCIFLPTCSNYAIDALERYGIVKGSYLSVRRILRCHPFSKGGIDEIPDE